jgi:hypothetical protein
MEATEDDEVFHWGREVDVKWGMLSWVTFRDQASLFSSLPTIPSRPQYPRPNASIIFSQGADKAATLTNGPRSSVGMGRTSTISIINVPPLRFIPRISHWQRQDSRWFRRIIRRRWSCRSEWWMVGQMGQELGRRI